jgi:hypothetical protein
MQLADNYGLLIIDHDMSFLHQLQFVFFNKIILYSFWTIFVLINENYTDLDKKLRKTAHENNCTFAIKNQ